MKSTTHKYLLEDSFQNLSLADNSVDLVVTSPPYPMVEMWDETFSTSNPQIGNLLNSDPKKAFEEMHLLLDNTWKECFRVLKQGGFACINIGDATRSIKNQFQLYTNHSRILYACHQIGFDILPCIIWRKPTNAPNKFMGSGMLPAGAYVTLEHEMILILRKGGKRIFSSEEKPVRASSALFWEERNTYFSDQWTDVIGTRQKLHLDSLRNRSGAFPIEIPLRLIQMYSQYGDVILDPFSGTGTTAHAAIASNRNSINLDNDEELLNASCKLPTRHKTKHELNDFIFKRVRDHMAYVHSKDILFFRYKNETLGFPVKTMQERQLNIFPIKSITSEEGEIQVQYRKFKKQELKEIYQPFLEMQISSTPLEL